MMPAVRALALPIGEVRGPVYTGSVMLGACHAVCMIPPLDSTFCLSEVKQFDM